MDDSFDRTREIEKNNIINGYPTTETPFVPDVIRTFKTQFKIMSEKGHLQRFAFTLVPGGSDLVQSESLEMIRQLLLIWFQKNPELLQQLESPLPGNLIAVSVAQASFTVGESCQDFKLRKRFKSGNGTWSHRQLSECIQCTYYNENNVEFLAGMCLYPAPHGEPMFLESNPCLAGLAWAGSIPYPLSDRRMSYSFIHYKKYGRFCSSAGKYVAVVVGRNDGIPRHMEFDYFMKRNKRVLCKECVQDYQKYKWQEEKNDAPTPSVATPPSIDEDVEVEKTKMTTGYSITKQPFIPDILKNRSQCKTMIDKAGFRRFEFTLAPEGSDLVQPESLEMIRQLLLIWFRNMPEYHEYIKRRLPTNLIAVSVAQTGFELGDSCHDFKTPTPSENGYLSYRKLSECIQCTYYNENGKEYLAGMCLYPAPIGKPTFLKENPQLARSAWVNAVPYPLKAHQKPYRFIYVGRYWRFCSSSGKYVALVVNQIDGTPRHIEFDYTIDRNKSVFCHECAGEYHTNKWEELKNGSPTFAQPFPVEPPAVSRVSSIASLLNTFEKIGGISDIDSDIDIEIVG
ncbi:unnamed protein product [Caenorhabditis brenneri]